MRWKGGIKGFTIVELLTIVFIIAVLATIIVPNLRRSLVKTHLSACQTNERNIATALQIYFNEYREYPENLKKIVDTGIMKALPTCPAAQRDTYSAGYERTTNPDAFTVSCAGKNHSDFNMGVNEPYYSSSTGLGP